jgi:hypothetical protein
MRERKQYGNAVWFRGTTLSDSLPAPRRAFDAMFFRQIFLAFSNFPFYLCSR